MSTGKNPGPATPTEGPPLDDLCAEVLRLDGLHTKDWTARTITGGAKGGATMEWGRVYDAEREIAHTDDDEDARLIATYRTAAPVLAQALLAAQRDRDACMESMHMLQGERDALALNEVEYATQNVALTQEVKRLREVLAGIAEGMSESDCRQQVAKGHGDNEREYLLSDGEVVEIFDALKGESDGH